MAASQSNLHLLQNAMVLLGIPPYVCPLRNLFMHHVCSHYLLIAVPVMKPKNSAVTTPFSSMIPRNEILLRSLQTKSVDVVDQPIPFVISSFHPDKIPTTFHFGYKWRHAFKQEQYYSVVFVAFTKSDVSLVYL